MGCDIVDLGELEKKVREAWAYNQAAKSIARLGISGLSSDVLEQLGKEEREIEHIAHALDIALPEKTLEN